MRCVKLRPPVKVRCERCGKTQANRLAAPAAGDDPHAASCGCSGCGHLYARYAR